jgi:hypothetical protein
MSGADLAVNPDHGNGGGEPVGYYGARVSATTGPVTGKNRTTTGAATMEGVLLLCFFGGIVFGTLGSWIAGQKNRSQGEGFALGCLFGPFGALIAALMPTLSDHRQENEPITLTVTPEQWEAIQKREEEQRVKRKADAEALEQFRRERDAKEQARQRAEAAFMEQEHERIVREREERARLRRQKWNARRKRLEDMPEAVKIVLGVVLGIATIVALFSIVVRLVPK